MNKFDLWWTSLAVKEKERIATKAARASGNKSALVPYPACSAWWISIPSERKQDIYADCTANDELVASKWNEGYCLSY